MAALAPTRSKSVQNYESSLNFTEDKPLTNLVQRALPKNEAEVANKALKSSRFGIRKSLGIGHLSIRKAIGGKALNMGNQTPFGDQLIQVRATIADIHRLETEFASNEMEFKKTFSVQAKEIFLRSKQELSTAKEKLMQEVDALILLDDSLPTIELSAECQRLRTIYEIEKNTATAGLKILTDERQASSLGELEERENGLLASLMQQKTHLEESAKVLKSSLAALDKDAREDTAGAIFSLSNQVAFINQVVNSIGKPNYSNLPDELASMGEELIYVRRLLAEHKQATGDVKTNAEKQAVFDLVFPKVADYLVINPKEGVFRLAGDNDEVNRIKALLEAGQPIPAGADPIDVSVAFKRIIKMNKIHGRNLLPAQQVAFRSLCNQLVETEMNTRMTYRSLAVGWGGVLRDGIDPKSLGWQAGELNRPDLMDYGFVDLFGHHNWDAESYRPRLTLLSTPLLFKQLSITMRQKEQVVETFQAFNQPDDENKEGDVRGVNKAEDLEEQIADLTREISLIEKELREREEID